MRERREGRRWTLGGLVEESVGALAIGLAILVLLSQVKATEEGLLSKEMRARRVIGRGGSYIVREIRLVQAKEVAEPDEELRALVEQVADEVDELGLRELLGIVEVQNLDELRPALGAQEHLDPNEHLHLGKGPA